MEQVAPLSTRSAYGILLRVTLFSCARALALCSVTALGVLLSFFVVWTFSVTFGRENRFVDRVWDVAEISVAVASFISLAVFLSDTLISLFRDTRHLLSLRGVNDSFVEG